MVPDRFTVREFSLEDAERQKEEMGRLNVDKKEQYVSQTNMLETSV